MSKNTDATNKKASGKIFIVEDNELNLRLFSDLLRAQGYEVSNTTNGNESIDLIRRFIPHVILMDVQLKGSVPGTDLIRQIKEDKYIGQIPVIAVTAFAMRDDQERIMASGCDAYISKPITIEPFLELIAGFFVGKV